MKDDEVGSDDKNDSGPIRFTDTGTCVRCEGLVSRENGEGLFKCMRCESVQSQARYPLI